MDGVMGVLVHVLRDQPQLLDQIELQVAALKPPSHIIEADFEVL
jgi:translation elongation factor EF-Ts